MTIFIIYSDSVSSEFSVLLMGLGGGSLVLHFQHYFPNCHVTAVEIDPAMVEISQSWFGLVQDKKQNRLHLVTDDAIAYVEAQAAKDKPGSMNLYESFSVQMSIFGFA